MITKSFFSTKKLLAPHVTMENSPPSSLDDDVVVQKAPRVRVASAPSLKNYEEFQEPPSSTQSGGKKFYRDDSPANNKQLLTMALYNYYLQFPFVVG
jgi:hypothetical protein